MHYTLPPVAAVHANYEQSGAAVHEVHRPDRRQQAFEWDRRSRPTQRDDDRPTGDPEACAEVAGYAQRGLLPPGWEVAAERAARWATRNGWGDEFELRSAALAGLWRVANSPQVSRGEVRDPFTYGRPVMWARMRYRSLHLRRSKWGRRAVVVDPGVLAQAFAARGEIDAPAPRADADEFWSRATAFLAPRQRECVLAVHRDGLSVPLAAEQIGVTEGAVKGALSKARYHLEYSLAGYAAGREKGGAA